MDGPSYWFDHIETIRKDKYQGQDTIPLPLFDYTVFSESFLLKKEADKYYYGDYPLRAADATAKTALDSAFKKGTELLGQAGYKSITLYAKHDPENFGKGYVAFRVAL